MDIKNAQQMVSAFLMERAWDKNLPTQRGAHLMREVSRLSEHTMYMEGMTIKAPSSDMKKQVGDIMFSLLALAERLGVDVEEQFLRAIEEDARKYPAAETRQKSLEMLREKSAKWLPSQLTTK